MKPILKLLLLLISTLIGFLPIGARAQRSYLLLVVRRANTHRVFHHLDPAHARRTKKNRPGNSARTIGNNNKLGQIYNLNQDCT